MLVGGGGRNAGRCFWGHVVAGVHERLAVCCSEREGGRLRKLMFFIRLIKLSYFTRF